MYLDPKVTDVACAGLNGMRMGERVLTVRRATEVQHYPPPPADFACNTAHCVSDTTYRDAVCERRPSSAPRRQP